MVHDAPLADLPWGDGFIVTLKLLFQRDHYNAIQCTDWVVGVHRTLGDFFGVDSNYFHGRKRTRQAIRIRVIRYRHRVLSKFDSESQNSHVLTNLFVTYCHVPCSTEVMSAIHV